MTIEANMVGVRCNLACGYCYQHPMRDGGNFGAAYDVDTMIAALEKMNGSVTLFGGEALLAPIADLERVIAWSVEKRGSAGVQTNGTLITDAHVALFKKYRVNVGFSMDGPDELNDSRWAGSLEKTREMTARSQANLERLCAEGIPPALIVTLYRGNASPERRPRLKAWLADLDRLGVWNVRLHLLESDHGEVRDHWRLTDEETVDALIDLAAFEETLPRMRFDLFTDLTRMLMGQDGKTSCIWHACDPYTTPAVQGIDGDGTRSNCGRTNKDGVAWAKAQTGGQERYLALYHTPQEAGGCQGCRFWLMCKGQCPGTAIDGDWRNRSEQCGIWMRLFERVERRLIGMGLTPISQSTFRADLEALMLRVWAAGGNTNLEYAQQALIRQYAGLEPFGATGDRPHGDTPHGDRQHGDREHGDHTDAARAARAGAAVSAG